MPGKNYEQTGTPFRFESPVLFRDARFPKDGLRECPTGFLLREAPWVWEVLELTNTFERVGPFEWMRVPLFLKVAGRVVATERARQREVAEETRRTQAQSKAGIAARSR